MNAFGISAELVGNELTATAPSLVAIANTVGQGRVVAFGHEGFANDGDMVLFDNLTLFANAFGWLDQNLLSDAGVVFIGNAWGAFMQAELDALNEFLQQGGGLFLMGLGWSWEPHNEGRTLDDYPMNQIGAFCGVR